MRILGLTSFALALSGCAFVTKGSHEERLAEYDADGDGFVAIGMGGVQAGDPNADCDDSNPAVNPAAPEICDGIDNNCDDRVDVGLSPDAGVELFADTDGDGYGDPSSPMLGCDGADGFVTDNTDCDDTNADINPDATEICNELDDNCDGNIDEGVQIDLYRDADGDGYGDIDDDAEKGCAATATLSTTNDDCDDTIAEVNPGADEICNGDIDDDCNGLADDADTGTINKPRSWPDLDGDGYGDEDAPVATDCIVPNNYVAATAENPDPNTDCNDTETVEGIAPENINPGAEEVCNGGIDDDCNGLADDDDGDDVPLATWYADTDGDIYGDPDDILIQCGQPDGYVDNNTDCLDTNGDVNPGAVEVCDKLDTDCSGDVFETLVPEDFTTIQAAIDAESDGGLICVDAGTYTENIDFSGKSLVLESFDGATATTIQGDGTGSVVTIANGEDDQTALRGFTVTGGNSDFGAGMYIENSAPTLEDLRVTGNSYSDVGALLCGGGGIYLSNSNAILRNSEIDNNSLTCLNVLGSGLHIDAGTPSVSHLEIIENSGSVSAISPVSGSLNGVGLSIDTSDVDYSHLIIAGNTGKVIGNGATANGCGINAQKSDSTFTQVVVHKNRCERGAATGIVLGAVFAGTSSTVTISNSDISENTLNGSNSDEAGLYTEASTIVVAYSNVFDNESLSRGSGPTTLGAGIITSEPSYMDTYQDSARDWDFTPLTGSPLINAGDPTILDPDGTTSDIGAYGGPGAANW